MLGNPILSQAINAEAADMLINSPEMYKKVVSECVEYSKQIDGRHVRTGDCYMNEGRVSIYEFLN